MQSLVFRIPYHKACMNFSSPPYASHANLNSPSLAWLHE
jgi:hypothetical protein